MRRHPHHRWLSFFLLSSWVLEGKAFAVVTLSLRSRPLHCSETDRESNDERLSFYVHIPYCRQRCRYCDFAIVPIGTNVLTEEREGNQSDRATEGFRRLDQTYRKALLQEVDLVLETSDTTNVKLQSVYFGGGTPSLASLETLRSCLEKILNGFNAASDIEITIEMDPGTFSYEKLAELKEVGFNRISLGVQSFDDTVLGQIGRVHRRDDTLAAVEMIHKVFGDDSNYSIDLISGLPAVSLAQWAETLETATSLSPKPSHLSLYDLQIESGTVFGKWYQQENDVVKSIPSLPDPEECAFMYKFASGYLRSKGYEHYEISSYALRNDDGTSRRSKHNQVYWEPHGQWLGKLPFNSG